MKEFLARVHLPPIYHDLGVSAFLVILVASTEMAGILLMVYRGQVAEAGAVAGVLSPIAWKFWDGYQAKRKDDEDRRERMTPKSTGGTS